MSNSQFNEQFDLKEKIQDLKNKGIKIKRVKKGEMAESIYLEKKEESEAEYKIQYEQVERMPSHKVFPVEKKMEYQP